MAETPFLPLKGIRVVDFATLAAGPACAKMLADYGAEDILLESETQLAKAGGSRQNGPPGMSSVNTAYFHNRFNVNKLSLTVDLAQPEGKQLARQLISISDVFIANRLTRVLKQFELTYEALREIRPDIIYLTMPTMGADAPRSFYSGVSWGIQAMAGLDMISGYPDMPPSSPSPLSHPDVSCNPLHAVVAILAALRHRRRTGQGQMIELAQYESSINWTGPAILQRTVNGTLMGRPANHDAAAAPHDVYRCRGEEQWCAIEVSSEEQWPALCHVIGRSDAVDDPRFASLAQRRQHTAELRTLIEAWTAVQDVDQVMLRLQGAGVPCAALNNHDRLLNHDPQLRARGLWTDAPHPELGTTLIERWGFNLSADPPPSRRAPLLGEHNDYVLQELIGLSEDEVNMHLVSDVLR
jgi:benzylsuccinate CoA-transferase BbsF subunit